MRAVLGRARLPASGQARFDPFPSASEARGVEFLGDSEEQDGKLDQ